MINATLNQNELVITGQMMAEEIVPNMCCAGHDWEVTLVMDDGHRDPAFVSVYGFCSNPACKQGIDPVTGNDYYRGVSEHCVEDIALNLLENQEATP